MKKNILLTLLIFILAILSLITLLFYINNDPCKNIKDPDELLESIKIDSCYIGIALNKSNIDICNKTSFNSNLSKYRCYYELAIKENDSEICNFIIEDYDIPIRSLNSLYKKSECFKRIALDTNNETICNYIKNETDNDRCMLGIIFNNINESNYNGTNISICELKTQYYTQICLMNLLVLRNDTVICENLSGNNNENFCIDRIENKPQG